jgi:hypothetical protein
MMPMQAQQHSTVASVVSPAVSALAAAVASSSRQVPVVATRAACSVPPQAMASTLAVLTTQLVVLTQPAVQQLGRPSLTRARRHRRCVVTEAR